ncbi:MAG TPA: NADH-quinone oxidoreductase subunit I [Deltaproteobacteria bacterium]|jgi:NADH-quinone oxidoreductase subunit I|nr:NADH-quinone oxidoreductase subunit I [SAR324 cluster bacterium]HBI28355.1 NADH-quinone oxidoreductase subunit I [Deltaproteobacteria bacterium]HIL16031.1 NADH-quinone oxidoreductase subunit I [Deltaproteobacteria bacterium]|tara:strand:+ start:2366 stop:2944 length:579 start_codon:yes stop_codon:yes gene_type:complete
MELKVKQMQRVDGFKESLYLPALFMGFRLTVRHFFRNLFGSKDVVTVQYPEEHRPVSVRWRGRHRLTRREDGFLKCVACYMCETVCPAKCIHIDAGDHPDLSVEKYPVHFDIDELRCVFCGLCVEACPKEAIRMDTGVISMAFTSRNPFDFTRDLLKDEYQPNEVTKFSDADLPQPKSQAEALPNSVGLPAA